MTALTDRATAVREPALLGQTVVVLGGISGIGLETARSARTEGARVVLTGRDPAVRTTRRSPTWTSRTPAVTSPTTSG